MNHKFVFSFAQVRFNLFFKNYLTVRITLGLTYSIFRQNPRTTCLYEICSKIVLSCCSFRKADAKVMLPQLPTKQKRNFFLGFFVNKYNHLKEWRILGAVRGEKVYFLSRIATRIIKRSFIIENGELRIEN